ncbi:DUF420 domain-containing protein [Aquisalibacillus elongatus]|uniref:Putative membrane protein n=1 Tax=Aquisalibacillus elongatus TaxID=485577 RepID=A0A3N5BLQ5_9BACI|nr:DUF420 domain-containing protein [Aquisalibacillus elongatus]RPF56110.1 putative membrane protein [Aquisalibacillus elongatus]
MDVPFLPTISTMFIVLSAIMIAIGWVLIVKNKREQHRVVMITGAAFALTFFILYVSRTVFVGSTSFGGPEDMTIYYTLFLIFHIILATTGAVFGIVTLTLAFKRNIKKHRKIGPITSIIWFFTALTGIAVYLLLYVLYEGEQGQNLFQAIFSA